MTQSRTRKYAFVPPRFCDGAGGAETLMRDLAIALKNRGDYVEIWTTCAKDNRTWENEFPAKETVEYGLKILRFKVDSRNLDTWVPIQISISEGMQVGLNDQINWMSESVNSRDLYQHIINHKDEFEAIFFAPYLFGTTFWGTFLAEDKAVLIPCLHNENYAYLEIMQSMFQKARGALFNAEPEMDLARSLYGNLKGGEVGMGFKPLEFIDYEPYLKDASPYILYLGRKETGKNAQTLIDYFIHAKNNFEVLKELKLVICGGGSFSDILRPEALERNDILDINHVSEDDKKKLIRNSLCLCQPSLNESFSIVLMEAWQLETPVLVHGQCAVTRDHVVKSGGGLYFTNESEFSETIKFFLRDRENARNLGLAGRQYVESYYSWEAVLQRFDKALLQIFNEEAVLANS